MAEAKDTKELLVAAGDVAVVIYKAQRSARKADGSLDAQAFAQAVAALVMTQPQVVSDLKAAFDNVSNVPAEIKALGFTETFDLLATAGQIAAKCAAAIKE